MPDTIARLKRAAVLVVAALTVAVAAPAQAAPDEYRAIYAASTRGMSVGRAELSLRRDGDTYYYSSEMHAVGIVSLFYRDRIRETSRGTLTERGIRPVRYDYHRSGSKERDDNIRFARGGGESIVSYKGDTREARLPAAALDPLSLHIALMKDVSLGRQHMRYLIAEPRRLRAYELAVRGSERIQTPRGELDAVRVDLTGKSDAGPDFDLTGTEIAPLEEGEQTSFWFAPELDYLLVRIRYVDPDDGTATIVLEDIEQLR